MPWKPPLDIVTAYRRPVCQFLVRDNTGRRVASAIGFISTDGGTGIMGDVDVDADGTVAQRTAAALIIWREAFVVADRLGIKHSHIEIQPAAMRLFYRVFGGRGIDAPKRGLVFAPLNELRSDLLNSTNEDGTLRGN